jgi:glycosyltransferase involved in cell wall biosynthesis
MRGWWDLGIVGRLQRLIEDRAADLVHTHLLRGDLFGRLAARRAGVPFVSTIHSTDPYRSKWYLGPLNWLERRSLKRSSKVICISEGVRNYTCQVTGLDPDLCEVVPNGIEMPEGNSLEDEKADRPFTMGAIGGLTGQKGHQILVEAMRFLGDESRCLVAGRGPLRRQLEKQARMLGVADRVRFVGWVKDIGDFLTALDLFVVPSLVEGQSLAALEAMAAGLPVVASRVGGLPEVVEEGVTGLLVPPGHPLELKDAIRDLRDDPDRRHRMGEAGRKRVGERFTAAKMAELYLEVYQGILE